MPTKSRHERVVKSVKAKPIKLASAADLRRFAFYLFIFMQHTSKQIDFAQSQRQRKQLLKEACSRGKSKRERNNN